MRLIDADYITEGRVSNDPVVIAAKCAPTIVSIPIGWLIDRANDTERAPLYRRYAQMLYEEWQKEQEER